ncbi:GntR family transcriptional regulator [Rhodococcus sp. BP-316]|uniref:GntR family transcriptional regulator n=1 Tax=Nocardiaceae TaxID=85025 RepID=UPI0009341568|nr:MULTISPECIES: GntR family transcriptional regulator [Rhodococcus]MBY6683109.1 GntR family transcriptional regulator [Rhodococcus sp. BP-316]
MTSGEEDGMALRTRLGTAGIIAQLRKLILLGELVPGEALRQEELSQRLGVSRVPIREAFLVLANQGLLVHRPNQGFVVAKRTAFELNQLHTLHTLLETELNSSIHWPDASALEHLRSLNAEMEAKADDGDVIGFIDLNHEFHRSVWSLSPHNLVITEVERIWTLSDAYFVSNYGSSERRRHAVEQHAQIIDALAAKDMSMFQKVSAEHRDDTRGGANDALTRAHT